MITPSTTTALAWSAPGVDDEWGGLLRREPPEAGLLQDVLHGFYPSRRPRDDVRNAQTAPDVLLKQDSHELFGVASSFAGEDGDEYEGEFPVMSQGLLEDVIQFPAFLEVAAAPSAMGRRRRG